MGVGDQVPPAIEQLGAKVEMLSAPTISRGATCRASTPSSPACAPTSAATICARTTAGCSTTSSTAARLIVQYNKFEFNDAQYGPYPASVSSNRVTDENAPVKVVDAVRTRSSRRPTKSAKRRGRTGCRSAGCTSSARRIQRYHDLLQLDDPFSYNPGREERRAGRSAVRQGPLGLRRPGLWRQLPAGTDGAYQLLANLISLGKAGSR